MFGRWPAISPTGTVAFVAGVEHGPSDLAVFLGAAQGLRRLIGQGDRLGASEVFAAFPLNPAVSTHSRGAVTFVTVATHGQGQFGIASYGP